jgi:hypothetical protein
MRSVFVYGADLPPLSRLVYQNQIGVTASVGHSVIRFLVLSRSRFVGCVSVDVCHAIAVVA